MVRNPLWYENHFGTKSIELQNFVQNRITYKKRISYRKQNVRKSFWYEFRILYENHIGTKSVELLLVFLYKSSP